MSRDNVFDRILTSTPVNRAAGLVSSSTQSGGFVSKGDGRVRKNAPLSYRAPKQLESASAGFQDLTGVKIGRMTVLGIFDAAAEGVERSEKKKQRWVVRCACGAYEVRSAKAIKNQENAEMGCFECGNLIHLRQRSVKQARGIIPRVSVEASLEHLGVTPPSPPSSERASHDAQV